ncbi:MAG: FG-GAP-like repeat-containing protein, partial [Bacteroidota bacterium]
LTEKELELIELMPEVKIPNAVFQNQGGLSFADVSDAWGLNQESYSNGAAYADLDNDGDLDLVVNNLSDSAFIFRNETISLTQEDPPNYLKIKLDGPSANPLGIGAEVRIETAGGSQLYTHYLTRGFLSSVAPGLTIGLDTLTNIDKLTVTWPTGEQQILRDLGVNGTITLAFQDADGPAFKPVQAPQTVFQKVPETMGVAHAHQENYLVEFNREFLMPHMVSTEGPAVTVGDVDGDGDEDFIVGGGKWQATQLFLQTDQGFVASPQVAFARDSIRENVALELTDVDQDGDLDLISLSGGNEWNTGHPNTQPRLYRNNGAGSFSLDESAFPETVALQGGALAVADFDQDGHVDVFLGARGIPYAYGSVPPSFLLKNTGSGTFVDVTQDLLPGSGQVGMVCDAHWADMNDDGLLDLVVAAEWEWPVILLQNPEGEFGEVHARTYGFGQEGLWNTLLPYDIDQDGDLDLLAGNLGLNSKLKATAEEPVRLYAEDLDNNGSVDHLLTYYEEGEEVLFATKKEITQQLLAVQKRFPQFTPYAQAAFEEIIPPNDLRGVLVRKADELRSGVFINQGEGNYAFEPFDRLAQVAPIGSFLPVEVGRERYVLAGGNFHATNIQFGRYDASYGVALEIQEDGKIHSLPNHKAGLDWVGEVRDLAAIQVKDRTIILVVRNNDTLLMVEPTPKVEMDFPIADQE